MEDLLSREIFSKVQEVVKEIIASNECETVNGLDFYDNLLSKLGFFTGLIIRPNREYIISTFDSTIEGIRDADNPKLTNFCSQATDNNVNALISLFLKGNNDLEKSWSNYLSISRGRGRKTKTYNKKKTKKIKRMKYK